MRTLTLLAALAVVGVPLVWLQIARSRVGRRVRARARLREAVPSALPRTRETSRAAPEELSALARMKQAGAFDTDEMQTLRKDLLGRS
jgi:hypothetical protein